MSGNGQHPNPFHRMDETPVQPPFLVRDANPEAVVERHRQRMATHPTGAVDIALPQKSEAAWRGKAALGLDFDQQEALIDALTGAYAEKYWQDMWARLYKRWGLGDILDTILGDGRAHPDRVQRVLSPLLFGLSPEIDEEARALLFLFRAWLLRQQVVVDRRAMSLIPVIGGAEMGSITTFTPALKRVDNHLWRLGWPGDERPDSPQLIAGDVTDALNRALPLFNDWYFDNQRQGRPDKQQRKPDHIYLLPWSDRLRQQKLLDMGQARLEEVSHNSMFRLHLPDGRRFILRSDPLSAVQSGLLAAGQTGQPPRPALAEINRAYLAAMARRGETAQSGEKPAAASVKPFDFLQPETAYVISIEGRQSRREITVTWVQGHKQALAVVCGSNHPARAVVMFNNRDRLGVAPVDYTSRKPNFDRLWAFTPADSLDWQLESDRLAISHWAAWVWHEKAGAHLPPGGDGQR